jgi:hypothetical protein
MRVVGKTLVGALMRAGPIGDHVSWFKLRRKRISKKLPS